MNKRLAELPESLLRNIVKDSDSCMAHCSANHDWAGHARWARRKEEYWNELLRRRLATDAPTKQLSDAILVQAREIEAAMLRKDMGLS